MGVSPSVEWVNHASFLVRHNGVSLLCDPWIEGTAFKDAWSLVADSQFTYSDFAGVQYLWFSHQHPDHFAPSNLRKIDPQVRRRLSVLYQQTADKLVINWCKSAGFGKVVELQPHQWHDIGDDVSVMCGPVHDDSWLAIRAGTWTLLNVNDCVLKRSDIINEIARHVGTVDVLFTQFSYAQWVGNPPDTELRRQHALEKYERLTLQDRILKPKIIVPFASFVYFCHEDNFFLNDCVNQVADVATFIEERLHKKAVVLYPGDRWRIGEPFDSNANATRYAKDFADRIAAGPAYFRRALDANAVQDVVNRFTARLRQKNPKARMLIGERATVYLADAGKAFEISIGGMRPVDIGQHDADIVTAGENVAYAIRTPWGGNTLHVGGRFLSWRHQHERFFALMRKFHHYNTTRVDLAWLASLAARLMRGTARRVRRRPRSSGVRHAGGVKERRFGIVVGMPNYAKYLARLINENSTEWRLRSFEDGTRIGTIRASLAMRRCEALICFGGPGPNVAISEAAREFGVPIVVIWAGSDVLGAAEHPTLLQAVRVQGYTHISDSPWLIDELRPLGIEATYLPVTAVREGPPIRPLPKRFQVLTYLPEPRRDFYGRRLTYEVAKRMPDVRFHVVGKGGYDPAAPKNVIFHGKVPDASPYLDDCTVLLRVPEHDGKSMFVLEALARARHVVWNHRFPHVNYAVGAANVLKRLRQLRAQHMAGTLQLNIAGREYALREFGRNVIAERFEQTLNAVAARGRADKSAASLRVALSGLPLFCAQLAAAADVHAPQCALRIMPTATRLQALTAVWTLLKSDVWHIIGSPREDRLVCMAATLLRKPQVIHWVGSDILQLEDPALRKKISSKLYKHLAEVDWTQRELREFGIEAAIAPLPVRYGESPTAPALPKTFTVLLYVPKNRGEFYGAAEYEAVMFALREEPLKYLIVGGGDVTAPDGVECENLGWRQDLRAAYERSTVLIRFTPHDGLSLMALEALSFGRYVMWSQPFLHAIHVKTYDEIVSALRSLLEEHKRGNLKVNVAGRSFALAEYDARYAMGSLVAAWTSVAVPRDSSPDAYDCTAELPHVP